jgi:hypothetical protein
LANTTYDLELSFLPLKVSGFDFVVYRRPLANEEQQVPGVRMLPEIELKNDAEKPRDLERKRYEVSYTAKEGFSPYRCFSWANADLTLDALFSALQARCEKDDLKKKVIVPKKKFLRHLSFLLAPHSEGDEVVWLRPYALRVTGEFGFLADFSFYAKDETKPTRRTLELSLAQKSGRPNRDYYADRHQKLQRFFKEFREQLATLKLHDGSQATISFELRKLRGTTLNERVYLLRDGAEVQSPFQGLKRYEPLKPSNQDCKLVFLFAEEDRPRSQELFRALRGDLFTTFPGMAKLFRCPLDKSNTSGMTIPSFTHESLSDVAVKLKAVFGQSPIVPIALVPFA